MPTNSKITNRIPLALNGEKKTQLELKNRNKKNRIEKIFKCSIGQMTFCIQGE